MEIKIDLDMNKIDYDSINQKILEKIETIDIPNVYRIDSKVQDTVNYAVKRAGETYLKARYGDYNNDCYELNSGAEQNIRTLVQDEMGKLIREEVDKILKTIPQDKIREMVSEMFPIIFVNVLRDYCTSDLYIINNNLNKMVYDRTKEIFNNGRFY